MDKKAIAVIINDIHYNIKTLEIADKVTRMAVDKANELDIPLIIAGDAHDTKANMRAECVSAIYETLQSCMYTYLLRGNHDSWNEKSLIHSLSHLNSENIWVVNASTGISLGNLYLIPYFSDPNELRAHLKLVPNHYILIMHQGLNSSNSGHYIQDRSAINPEDVAGRQVISGHYHTRQEIKLPGDGLWTYTGNPYTLNFGEANDPEKGFHVLYADGSLEFIPTNVRRHTILLGNFSGGRLIIQKNHMGNRIAPQDQVWVKIEGTREQLTMVTKTLVSEMLEIDNFKLDLIPLDSETQAPQVQLNQSETLDILIDSLTNTSDDQKQRLKQLWKDLK